MSQFKTNEGYDNHVSSMDYTSIQNAKATAIDSEDWDELTRLQGLENDWLDSQ